MKEVQVKNEWWEALQCFKTSKPNDFIESGDQHFIRCHYPECFLLVGDMDDMDMDPMTLQSAWQSRAM